MQKTFNNPLLQAVRQLRYQPTADLCRYIAKET